MAKADAERKEREDAAGAVEDRAQDLENVKDRAGVEVDAAGAAVGAAIGSIVVYFAELATKADTPRPSGER